ncbi:unnamed protein product [Aphanomyces euteiches]|uniref:GST N-terminal domain-containing protein n=1 Tax=Aphanomyces euteiches TaxID=100861 RepID=A0A6G0X2H1_9STRA|nr:hypothetical protein Ae201684_009232 [Aphanomyces euteiches]KAH9070515.1 hypothetical protein Ae201684P_002872 [Aphanomyces euteiches]KAH9133160.1 hypothetical protein AeRB84_020714 [Aphanomyces euteiches]
MRSKLVLVTIPASNYCEKARWGLRLAKIDFTEEMHASLFAYMSTKTKGGKSVPLLFGGKANPDFCLKSSDDILTYCGKSLPSLYPNDRVKEMELQMDNKFGPAARRFGYSLLFSMGTAAKDIMIDPLQGNLESYVVAATFPLLKAALIKSLNISDKGVERSWVRIQETFAKVDAILGDAPLGTQFIAGSTFSAADISFCSHASLLLGPSQNPFVGPYFQLQDAPQMHRDRYEELVSSKAGQFVLWCYANHYPRDSTEETTRSKE